MQLISAALISLILIGIPWAATSYWVRRRVAGVHDRLEIIGLGFAGVGVVIWTLWTVAGVLGASPPVGVASLALVTGVIVWDARRAEPAVLDVSPGATRYASLVCTAFLGLVAVCFLPFGLVRGEGVHTVAMTDWYKHLVVTAAVAGAEALPPANPFLLADPDSHYYLGFHQLAALVSELSSSPGDVYPALLVVTLLVAIAVPLVLYGYGRSSLDTRGALLVSGVCLLAGFDLVVVVIDTLRHAVGVSESASGFDALRALVPSTHLDYWIHHNDRQANAFLVSTAWAPQHVAAVLVALVVLSLMAPESPEHPERSRAHVLLPAVVLASVPALSGYVAMALGVGVVGWLGVSVWSERTLPWRSPPCRRWVSVGALSLVLSLPVLTVLAGGEGSSSGFVFAVSGSGGWSNGAVWNGVFGSHWWTNLLDTPALYAVELGVVGLLATPMLIRVIKTPTADNIVDRERSVIVLAVLVLVTFVRPPLDGPNNLYARPMLLVFAMLAPSAVAAATSGVASGWRRPVTLVCVLGTGYAAAGMVLQGLLFWSLPIPLANACAWVTQQTPHTATLAVRPDQFTRYVGFVCRRPLVVADRTHARLLGATDAQYDAAVSQLTEAYAGGTSVEGARGFDLVGADTILVGLGPDRRVPPWLDAPCFETGFQNEAWIVATRRRDTCNAQ